MVDSRTLAQVEDIVRDRLKKSRPEIMASMTHIANGNPLAAEQNVTRRMDRLQTKASLSPGEAKTMSVAIDLAAQSERKDGGVSAAAKPPGPEAIIGSADFVGIAFLERGRRVADAVGRVAFLNGAPQGSGFLVAPGLFLTNHHVISSQADAARFQVQFDYEHDWQSTPRTSTAFAFEPSLCFATDGVEGLDYTLIALGNRRDGARNIEELGYIPISDARDKHMLGEVANVIQHPDGRYKEVVLRENRLVARDETMQVLHYVADTEQGSSGSPVFNNEWEPIALHHWAGPYREIFGTDGRLLLSEINEGIRISGIIRDLRDRRASFSGATATAVEKALALWDASPRGALEAREAPLRQSGRSGEPSRSGSRINDDGSVTWTFPVEISVRAPLLAPAQTGTRAAPSPPSAASLDPSGRPEAATWKTEDFSDRAGYEVGFIPGFVVPLPRLRHVPHRVAKNLLAGPGEDPHELRYHHFSIAMNAERRLAYFTACNIDGARVKAVIRDDKSVIDDPTLKDLGVESMGAEASDAFRPDRRIDLEEQMNRPFYEKQIVAGFPEPTSRERIARIFQKGHIIMRGDPAWGTTEEAVSAERDTFFYTNAAPQLGFFNQGSDLSRPGSKGKLRWRAVETYVLRNAVTTRQRIGVFAGPIFADDDPPYRMESKIPMRFWKIAFWTESTRLNAIALLADQKPLIKVMPEAIGRGAEAFADSLELARVSEFLSTVEEIEEFTGLDFGADLRAADIRRGAESKRVAAQDMTPDHLKPPARSARKKASARRPAKRSQKKRR